MAVLKTSTAAMPRSTNALILRLHWKLLKRMMRQEPMQQFQIIAWIFITLITTSLALTALVLEVELLVLISAAGVFALWALQTTMPAPESQIDPADFRSLPISNQDITRGLLFTEVLQSRGILAILASVATAIAGSVALANAGHPGLIAAYLPGIVLSFATAILGNAWLRTTSSGLEDSDSGVLRVLIGAVLLLGIFYALMANPDLIFEFLVDNAWLTTVVLLTPLGAAIGPAYLLLQGHYLAALGTAVLAVGYAYILWRLGLRGIAKSLQAPDPIASKKKAGGSSNLVLPGLKFSAFSASYSRAMRYFWRDSRLRYLSLLTFLLCGGFGAFGYFTSNSAMYVNAFIFSFMFLAQYSSNIYGLMGPGMASAMLGPIQMRRDLFANVSAWVTIAALFGLCFCLLAMFLDGLHPGWVMALANIPAICVVFGFASAWVSSHLPNATSAPGTNPMRDRSNQGGGAFASIMLMGLFNLPLLPGFIISIYAIFRHEDAGMQQILSSFVFWGGVALNWVVAAIMAFIISRLVTKRLENKTPEIFAKVRHWL